MGQHLSPYCPSVQLGQPAMTYQPIKENIIQVVSSSDSLSLSHLNKYVNVLPYCVSQHSQGAKIRQRDALTNIFASLLCLFFQFILISSRMLSFFDLHFFIDYLVQLICFYSFFLHVLIFELVTGTIVDYDTTGDSVFVDSTQKRLVVGEKLLVSQRSVEYILFFMRNCCVTEQFCTSLKCSKTFSALEYLTSWQVCPSLYQYI